MITRRSFITGLAALPLASAYARKLSANDKLNIGVIGVAGRGGENLNGISSQNIVALCDVDERNLAAAAAKFPSAKTYHDFRQLIDQKDIDAIVVSTPDHTHAVACVAALKSGRHLYCEKPLTHTISECRRVRELAARNKLVTQLGTQIHAGTNYRRVVELVQSGAVGPIEEVHVWAAGAGKWPKGPPELPAYLHYDLWLGPVPERPYDPEFVPLNWRYWWAFGGGTLADFGCHFMDLPHWALDLHHASTCEVVDAPPVDKEHPPRWLIVRYQHPARGDKPPVKLTWYHGGKQPTALLTPEQAAKWKSGVLFLGKKGMIMSDYGKHVLLPEKDFEGFVRPEPFIKDSIGHHLEWIEACKTGGPTTCNFDYSGALTETALLGNVAYRVGKKLEWDARKLRATNCPEADQFIQHHYRKGWKLG
ncbi:MAG TPA: Gfo/Idh/MocA family oxidoreductase [Verrucomicrobiae bacterium]|nr:Gfo/Idh/MocA family oxidoreductase [Verrucomicrobiae bacterium]